jgi:hypothetical protein
VKNLNLNNELDDFDGGDYYEDGDEGGKSSQSSQPICFFLIGFLEISAEDKGEEAHHFTN